MMRMTFPYETVATRVSESDFPIPINITLFDENDPLDDTKLDVDPTSGTGLDISVDASCQFIAPSQVAGACDEEVTSRGAQHDGDGNDDVGEVHVYVSVSRCPVHHRRTACPASAETYYGPSRQGFAHDEAGNLPQRAR
jgi:hypothetical protein